VSQVVSKDRCPRCEEQGRDRHRDNLAVYSDGHEYCFACGYYKPSPLSQRIKALDTPKDSHTISLLPGGTTSKDSPESILRSLSIELSEYTIAIPSEPLSWLRSYGITPAEIRANRILWSPSKQRLLFPVYDGNRLVLTNERYFGTDTTHPKYITHGNKQHCKLFHRRDSVALVLVEDFVSGIKVGRQYSSIPLFGSHFNPDLVLALVSQQKAVRVWLDLDKAEEARKLTKRALQWLPDCGTIITEKDPKEYTDMEIKAIVSATLPRSIQSVSQ